jgi:hypothetical protein
MSLVKEDSIDDTFNGFIDWRIIKNNICSFATEF